MLWRNYKTIRTKNKQFIKGTAKSVKKNYKYVLKQSSVFYNFKCNVFLNVFLFPMWNTIRNS